MNKDYYNLLPAHIKKQFKANLEDSGKSMLRYLAQSGSPGDFIDCAFTWSNTPEGDDYWADLNDMFMNGETSPEDFEAFFERYPEHSSRIINNYPIY